MNIIIFNKQTMIFKVIFGKQIHLINSNDKKNFKQFLSFIPSIFKTLPSRFTLSYFDSDGDQITLKNQSDYEVLLNSGFKTVKVTIREDSEEFMEITSEVQIEQNEPQVQEIKFAGEEISQIKVQEEKVYIEENSHVQESLIEDKLRKMMPEIISKIKSEISEEIKEKSRISRNNEPVIIEQPLNSKPQPKEEPKKESKKDSGVVVHERVNCDGCGQKGIIGIRYKCAVCADFDFCEKCEATVEHDHPFLKIKTLKQTPLKIFIVVNHDQDSTLEINGQRVNIPSQFQGMVEKGLNFVEGFLRNGQGNGFRGMCGRRNWGCHRNQAKEQTKKQEEKVEVKPEVVIEKKEEEKKPAVEKVEKAEKVQKINQESIVNNAKYLQEVFGTPLEKCLLWAQRFPFLTKEQLLNHCISTPEFLN